MLGRDTEGLHRTGIRTTSSEGRIHADAADDVPVAHAAWINEPPRGRTRSVCTAVGRSGP